MPAVCRGPSEREPLSQTASRIEGWPLLPSTLPVEVRRDAGPFVEVTIPALRSASAGKASEWGQGAKTGGMVTKAEVSAVAATPTNVIPGLVPGTHGAANSNIARAARWVLATSARMTLAPLFGQLLSIGIHKSMTCKVLQ